mgnify:FL=1
MKPVFITPSAQPSARWYQAFPDLQIIPTVKAYLTRVHRPGDGCWLDISPFDHDQAQSAVVALAAEDIRVMALSYLPSEAEAYGMLSSGARGYCHAQAPPSQLQEVATAVMAGGYWMPPILLQRLVSAAIRIDSGPPIAIPQGFESLTEREHQVALEVGRGANNREIATTLAVSERTVKAHLTSIFDKLSLRDRVQLALLVNRLPVH